MTADPFAAKIEEFRLELERRPGRQNYLGSAPTLNDHYDCTFCGKNYIAHDGAVRAAFQWDMNRVLREAHRGDFGPDGYYDDEPKFG